MDGRGGEGYVRGMTKALGGRPKNYTGDEPISSEAFDLARGLVDSLSANMKQLVKFGGEHTMTPRQKQKLASEVAVSLFMQPLFRDRYADWCLQNPGEAAKLALSQVPKEIHIEQNVQHSIVVLPAGQTAEQWMKENEQVEDAEVISWLTDRIAQ